MNKVLFDRIHRRRIAREAADWHIRMAEPASEAEVAAFEAWVDTSADHARTYAELERVGALGERLPSRALRAGEGAAQSRPFRPGFALAATAALLLLFGSLWIVGQSSGRAEAAINNDGPSTRAVRLKDGTAAILDSGAELTVRTDARGPAVTLRRGRVRFRTAPGASAPLSVAASGALVRARDSLFDVTLDGGTATIRVLKGEVDVRPEAGADGPAAAAVSAGEGAEVRDGRIARTDARAYDTRWPAARVSFEDAPLADVVAKANGVGGPRIELSGNDVAQLRVTGVLDLRDTRALAAKLAATLGLRVERREDTLLLKR